MNRNKLLIISFVIILISAATIAFLYRNAYPLGGVETDSGASEIKEKSVALLNEIGINYENLAPEVKLRSHNALLSRIQKQFGLKKSNEKLRAGIPGYYWQVSWDNESGIVVTNSDDNRRYDKQENYATLKYDTKGRLLGFTRNMKDSVAQNSISKEEAENIAGSFIRQFVQEKELDADTTDKMREETYKKAEFSLWNSVLISYKDHKKIEQGKNADYEFYYSGKDSLLPDEEFQVTVTVSGNVVSGYKSEFLLKEDDYQAFSIYDAISDVLFYVVIFIMIAVIGFRRVRAFEIGFRTAIIMGVITAICFGLEIYLSLSNNMGWEVLIPLILGPLFAGGGVLLVWAVSETVTRETWSEKFVSIDLFTKGYFLHSRVGSSLLIGITAGTAIAALLLLMVSAADIVIPLGFVIDENSFLSFFNSPEAGLSIINHFVYTSIFTTSVFFLFLISGLKRRVNTTLLFIIAAGLWGIVNSRGIDPIYLAVLIEIIIGFVLVYLFYKYDLLSVLVAIAAYQIILSGTTLFLQNSGEFTSSGYFLASIFIILILLTVISQFTKDNIQDFQNIAPAFVKNITERERMQRELEIARDVQMSFLPRESPDFKGLDIAGRCYPALEVGGDYFDFISLDKCTSGIIVGDVSGKGTQAAFYMTLTKGFLKAVSKLSASPSEVLSQMNELFYENCERGTFISMIYGVFDTENRKFRLARAGHNPVIVKSTGKGKVEMINPTGLALGLEKGIIFRKTITEVELPFNSGEVYVFYTDGFTEAMNREKEEYGEKRLMHCIEENSEFSADIILEKVFTDVKSFIGKARQHDDMTIVVVKIR